MRHKHNKRKEAAFRSNRNLKRKFNKVERDKDVFKKRKFIKNNFVESVNVDVDSSSEEEPVESCYGQMLQVFGNAKDKNSIESSNESSSSDDEVDDERNSILEDVNENDASGSDVDADDKLEIESEEKDTDNEEITENLDIDGESSCTGTDPFTAHFECIIEPEVVAVLNSNERWNVTNSNFSSLGNINISSLKYVCKSSQSKSLIDHESDMKVSEDQKRLMTSVPVSKELTQLHLKQNLIANIPSDINSFQLELLSIMSSYKDLLYTEQTHDNREEIRYAYTLHALNHILKTRTKILNNNAKHEAREGSEEKLRDQGFTRPKILIVVPFKECCRKIVELLISLLHPSEKGGVANRKRFNEDYAKIETKRKDKPDDYYEIFQGNIDDSFKLGIGVTKKSLKLYTDFYSSDIIISSPLGLRMVTGVEGDDKKTDTDFLSSIELLIVDQADVIMMQNWDHLMTVVNQMHIQPKESHGVDYSRIRLWSLDGHSRYYRQTLIFSGVPSPEINSLWNKNCMNYMGKAKVFNSSTGTLERVVCDTPIVWHRVECGSLQQSLEDRFKYFTEKIMPQYQKDSMDHTLIFVSSYFDFVKVRNWFKFSDLDYSEISEYSKDKKVAQARDMFYHNEKHFILYTERAHFYRRFRIKGIRHLIFYQPPTFGWMYSELCNLLHSSYQNPRGGSENNMSITVIYSKYDAQRLSLCAGSETSSKMMSSDKTVHMFKPGDV